MHTKFILLFLFYGLVVVAQKKKICLAVGYYQPYCGGARPTPEIQRDAEQLKPYAGKTLVIVDENGRVDSAKTNKEGTLRYKLNRGSYKVFEAWRYYKRSPNGQPLANFDPECLKAEWQKEVYTVTVGKKGVRSEKKNDIILFCTWKTPCLQGERPPGRQ